MPSEWVFDFPHYCALDAARMEFLRPLLSEWKAELGLHSALDVACGVGRFAALLHEFGFEATAVEGRPENAKEARRRVPEVNIQVGEAEEISALGLGSFDLILCLGLLYHLENPLRVIRQLRSMTGKLLVIESMCLDDPLPVLQLRDEGGGEDQGLRHIAFYPSEACLAKMLYGAGFPFVYRFLNRPDHPDFSAHRGRLRVRAMLAAAAQPMAGSYLAPVDEPATLADPWLSPLGRTWRQIARLARFAVKPWPEKMATVRRRREALDFRRS